MQPQYSMGVLCELQARRAHSLFEYAWVDVPLSPVAINKILRTNKVPSATLTSINNHPLYMDICQNLSRLQSITK